MQKNERGFTTIELLVAVGIIGILAVIAISQFSDSKVRAFNARAESDLRNIISAQEAQYVDNESFSLTLEQLEGFDTSSPSVSVVLEADDNGWSGSSYHPLGDKTYCYNSRNSEGIVQRQGLNQPCA